MQIDLLQEARRQAEICNACRYCEGFCDVFPAITRDRTFASGDLMQLANLCHNCRGCYYACQYTPPHEFALNLPAALADLRQESWERLARPAGLARLFQRSGTALAAALVAGIALLFWAISTLTPQTGTGAGTGFYAYLSHVAMVAIFLPAFVLPLLSIAASLRAYWRETGGRRLTLVHWRMATSRTARLRNLSGGHGDGCNFEKEERFTQARRHLHQATMYGFLLCFLSTVSGTLLHYGLGWKAPYDLFSLPKLLGLPGGVLLTLGAFGLAWLKTRADPALGAVAARGGEFAFTLLLGATGATGLALYAVTGTAAVPVLLALHLGCVLTLFVLMPFSKMAHGFYRFAALLRDAQERPAPV